MLAQPWCESEAIRAALNELASALRADGVINESERYIVATFALAKVSGAEIGLTKRDKGVKVGVPLISVPKVPVGSVGHSSGQA